MIIGGYKKESILDEGKDEFVYLEDLSIACSYEELIRIAAFFNKATALLDGYSYPHGACTLQFRDEDPGWTPEERDIVLVISSN